MMLRSLVDEVVRRRMWPIPLAALLIAIAAPVLFMKSAPAGAPSASSAPPAAAPGQLPASAGKVVSTSDKAVIARQRSKAKAQDPFAPPASAKKSASTTSATKSAAKQTASTPKAIPLVITNSNGDKLTISTPKTKKKTSSKKTTAPKTTTPQPTTPTVSVSKPVTYVDVRFGKALPSKVHHRVPRMETFRAGGKVAAIFVKYSPARNKAVFAVAPSTKVKGDVKCRRKAGACRYVDLGEGQHVRLSMRAPDGSVVSRRLDVVSIYRASAPISASGTPATTPLSTPIAEATCLLKRLLSLSPILPSISVDACA
jgi:hypothetical protein